MADIVIPEGPTNSIAIELIIDHLFALVKQPNLKCDSFACNGLEGLKPLKPSLYLTTTTFTRVPK